MVQQLVHLELLLSLYDIGLQRDFKKLIDETGMSLWKHSSTPKVIFSNTNNTLI